MITIILFVIVVALLILIIKPNKFPSKIWTYWDSEDLPEIVTKCTSNWKHKNPGYEIILLNKDNLKYYLPEIDIFSLKFADTPARTSDFIRLCILSKYGGVWCDATCIMSSDLTWAENIINNSSTCEYVGYYKDENTTNQDYKSIESWFFVCPEDSSFVKLWRDEFMRLNTFDSIDEYVKSVADEGVDLQRIGDTNYLTIYVACQRVMQKLMSVPEIKNKLHLLKLEDDLKPPSELCKSSNSVAKIIKFSRFERSSVSPSTFNCVLDKVTP